jgi:molybdopterin-guanine dinucleotide biosynthesis protein A
MATPATPQDLINALIAAAQAAAVAAVPAAAPIPPVVAQALYAVMPRAANPNVLDFNQTDALKLFNKAIAPLDTKLDLAEANLRTFLEQVREQSRIFNWDSLLTVDDATKVPRNLIDS